MVFTRRRIARMLSLAQKMELEKTPPSSARQKRKRIAEYEKRQETLRNLGIALTIKREDFIHGRIPRIPHSSFAEKTGAEIMSVLFTAGRSARYTAPLGVIIGLSAHPSLGGALIGLFSGPLITGTAYRGLTHHLMSRNQGMEIEYNAVMRILKRRRLFVEGKIPLTKVEITHNEKVLDELKAHLESLSEIHQHAIEKLNLP
ncbi:MAG: hypothetical protein AABX02_01605 [archaeon]